MKTEVFENDYVKVLDASKCASEMVPFQSLLRFRVDRSQEISVLKGAVSRNSAELGNYKMAVKLRET